MHFNFPKKNILNLLKKNIHERLQTSIIAYKSNHRLQARMGESVNKERYQRLVGQVIYLTHTRLDIAYAISLVSQFMHDPRESYMQTIFWILRYLKSTTRKMTSLFLKMVAINITQNLVQHDKTKHIEIGRHFIKEKLTNGVLSLFHFTSDKQLVDVFTKGLSNEICHNMICKLGMHQTKTFSPMSKKDSLHVIMESVSHFNLELHQMDVKMTFLNRDLKEEVYMK
ncbi:Copia protein [Gossypium australe]|uniref:Copia protein n=1 Tax=Gossypium australe TaxID=47621 RepID=A0A5B6VDI7_9ROSI|nr:Copia protein [Gossypium australe]